MQSSGLILLLSALLLVGCSLKLKQDAPLLIGKYTHNFYGGGYEMLELKDSDTFHFQVRVGMNWIDAEGTYQQDGSKLYLTTFDQEDDTKYTILNRSGLNQKDSLTLFIQGYELPLPYAIIALSPKDSLVSNLDGVVTIAKSSIQEEIAIEFTGLWNADIPKDSIQADTVQVKLFEKPRSVYWNQELFKIRGKELVKPGKFRRRFSYTPI